MDKIILKVNNKNYENWVSLSIHRSVDEFCGSFSFVSTDSQTPGYPIKEGDSVVITVNDVPMITGFVDEISASISIDAHDVTINGRDNVGNLIDSDIPNNWKTAEGVTNIKNLQILCEFVISATGNDIDVINTAGRLSSFSDEEIEESESGQKAIDFLSSFARKRNVYLNTDGNGSLRIYRPENISANDSLVLLSGQNPANNILSRTYRTSGVGRFRSVTFRSQENMSTGFFDFIEADASGSASDAGARSGRVLDVITEEEMTASECTQRAKEEVNIRRARSTEYTCTVPGAAQTNGDPWDYGLVVDLTDEIAGIQGQFFVKSATITRTLDQGTLTDLVLVPTDAYKVKAELTNQDTRVSNFGDKYNR